MERKRVVKKNTRIIVWAVLLFVLFIRFIIGSGGLVDVNSAMQQGLDINNASGDKLVAYNPETDTYSKEYVPFGYQTSKPEEVGGILYITKEIVSRTYSGGIEINGHKVHAELVDCSTGEVVASYSFSPMFPDRIKAGGVVKADEGRIKSWVEENWYKHLNERK